MGDRARVGVVGLGPMGRDHVKSIVAESRGDVVALCDCDPGALAEARGLLPGPVPEFSTYADMLAAGGLDGVVVATPQHLHVPMSIAGLEAGCHVFCEKPMGLNVRQCQSAILAAERAGKELMIGQVLRYLGQNRFVLETVRSGELGKPLAMRTSRTSGPWGSWRKDWRLKRETCGGMLFEVNVHEIDLMLNILGEASEVTAAGFKTPGSEVDYEDFITAQIRFKDGEIGSITSACCDFVGRNGGEVFLEDGTIYYDSFCKEVHLCKQGEDKQVIPYDQVAPGAENGLAREIREFVETCLGEHPATIPGEEGLRAVEICEAAYLSASEGRPVALPLPRG